MIDQKTKDLAMVICKEVMENGAELAELAGTIATASVLAVRALSNYTDSPWDWEETATSIADALMRGNFPETKLSEETLFYVRNYEDMFHNISMATGILLEKVLTQEIMDAHPKEIEQYAALIKKSDYFCEQIEERLKKQGYEYRINSKKEE